MCPAANILTHPSSRSHNACSGSGCSFVLHMPAECYGVRPTLQLMMVVLKKMAACGPGGPGVGGSKMPSRAKSLQMTVALKMTARWLVPTWKEVGWVVARGL